jgi:glycosyltransferase involved in cell wall biosynthesis
MDNKFTIIIPSYNNSDWVEYNLASILNQTYENWRVIYINDYSTDDTINKVRNIIGDNPKFTIIDNSINRGATFNYFENLESIDDTDIVLHLDGDDWLVDNDVLGNLNNFYNKYDYWMTYGGMVVWDGINYTPAHPQNTPYSDFVHKYKLYRRDTWRSSHLRTYRANLLKSIQKSDLKDLKKGEYYWHAVDLAFQYAAMEMCGRDRIGVVDFYTYVYNQHPSITQRTRARESVDNNIYELEIRNRKKYDYGIGSDKIPLINVIGDFRERNSIPTKFSYVYNQTMGEFDITLIQDMDCIRYVNGEIPKINGIVIADIHEAPHLMEQKQVYDLILDNYTMFDYIFTYDSNLLKLPNSVFRNGGYECVLNKNVHKHHYPILTDESLFSIYDKNRNISFITSNKTFTELHRFRNECVQYISNKNVDIYGVGYNEILGKIDGLKDYKYSISIENGIHPNYFTEKILDCFLTGTIPIYKGCPNIGDFFDTRGIIVFNTTDELVTIIDNIKKGEYIIDKSIIEYNYNKALEFCYDNDRFYEKYLRPILKQIPY